MKNLNKPKLSIEKLYPDNMDEYNEECGYRDYNSKLITLKVVDKYVSDCKILLDVKVSDFLNKDDDKRKIKKYLDSELTVNSIYIKRIYTKDSEKNKGYASVILEYVYKLAKKNNCNYITLDSMPESKKFWVKKGFEVFNKILQTDKSIRYYNMIKKL